MPGKKNPPWLMYQTLARNTQVICAKCGKQQSVSSNCEHCRIAFYKFKQSSDSFHSKAHEKQKYTARNQSSRTNKNVYVPSRNNSNTARNVFIGIFIFIMMVFAITAIVRKLDVSQQNDFNLALNKYNLNFRGVPYSIVFGKSGEFIADDNNRQRKGQQYIHSLINY